MEERRSSMLNLDVNNFDSKYTESSRYVLTSPRPLESCARLGIRPVELLYKSLSEFVEEQRDAPMASVTVLYDAYEKERRRRVGLCRNERKKVVEGDGSKSSCKNPFLETPEQTTKRPSSESKIEKAGVGGTSVVDKSQLMKEQDPSNLGTWRGTSSADLKNQCLSTESWGASSHEKLTSSFSLGEQMDSMLVSRKLDRLTSDIRKKTSIAVPQKDLKIAALMLLKHKEEQLWQARIQKEGQLRERTQRQEALQRARVEQQQCKARERNARLWQVALDARRMRRKEAQQARQRKQEETLNKERWRQLAEEQQAQKQQRLEGNRREAQNRKRYQERLLEEQRQQEQHGREQESQLALDRELRASRSKQARESRQRRRIQLENQQQRLRHLLLKREVEQATQVQELQRRSGLEKKLRHFEENHAQRLQAREQELRGQAVRGEEFSRKARLRAGWREAQQELHRQLLAQLGEWRMERAAELVRVQRSEQTQKTRRTNAQREHVHRVLREQLLQEEEALQRRREGNLISKERRWQRLHREREAALEAARRIARASSNMRERIKEAAHSRTFDQMALEAQLTASLGRCKL
ncbi:coiled-coil domain-containing protein 177 [Brienomyrus brachyistius]|uniref:coiled-coil domain-containing protein 177 n=1 Tax=Brienomyrus brachyistius TaxID=42636 RepID=UPI0020B23E79|nr:coiled-coil domain-containing protein 177 [Brienomyrus brachyistius]XP_048862809.1 coiled-coil domain-containing protein 177 [Brienomyrus brachyistius]